MRFEWELRVESPGSALLESPDVLRVMLSVKGIEEIADYYVQSKGKAVAYGLKDSPYTQWKFRYPNSRWPDIK